MMIHDLLESARRSRTKHGAWHCVKDRLQGSTRVSATDDGRMRSLAELDQLLSHHSIGAVGKRLSLHEAAVAVLQDTHTFLTSCVACGALFFKAP